MRTKADLRERLSAVLDAVADQAAANPEFGARLAAIWNDAEDLNSTDVLLVVCNAGARAGDTEAWL